MVSFFFRPASGRRPVGVGSASGRRRAGAGSALSRSSPEGVLLSEIGFECINRYHLIQLVGVELMRIDVGCLFREIGNFQ